MSTSTIEPVSPTEAPRFEPHALTERHSFLLGTISLYAPNVPHAEWMQHPWRIATSRGWEGYGSAGLEFIVKPGLALEAMNHIGVIGNDPAWARYYLAE